MRRHLRALTVITVLLALAVLALGFQKVDIGPFERGDDTLLGLSLGLDLQGGSHLVYRADLRDPATDEVIPPTQDQMESLKATIERRVNASGLGEPIIQIMGTNRLLIQLPGVRDTERAKTIIGETAQLVWKHRSLRVPRPLDEIADADIRAVTAGAFPIDDAEPETDSGGPEDSVQDPAADAEAEDDVGQAPAEDAPTAEDGETAAESEDADSPADQEPEDPPAALIVEFTDEGASKFAQVADRLDQSFQESILGTSGLTPPSSIEVSVQGAEQLRFDVFPYLIRRIGDTNRFAFAFPQVEAAEGQTRVEAAEALLGDAPTVELVEIQAKVDEDIGLTGDDLARAYPSQHAQSGVPIVTVEFKDKGARIFGELTKRIAGTDDQVAIFLDDVELISPRVETAITGGSAIIQGRDFTIERVRDISLLLESGRLPVPIALDQERDVDAILGADSLAKSVVAGLVGLGLVFLFMTLYYRVPGLVASVALVMYAAMVLAIFKLLPITLTLSGVAALILSIGMAVDANILIFERMKDELRSGRTLLSSINIGFNRAWPAIRDGNVSTLITCAILFWFSDQLGVTAVQGFAAALAIGVLMSMFSAILVSRTLLRVTAAVLSRQLQLFVPHSGKDLPQRRRPATAAQRTS